MRKKYYIIAIISSIIFLSIAVTFNQPFMKALDKGATNALAGNEFVALFHYLAETKWMITVVLLFILFVCLKWRDYRGVAFICASFVGGFVLNLLVKNIVQRPRPEIADQLTTYSFPSAHAMLGLLYLVAIVYICVKNMGKTRAVKVLFFTVTVLIIMIGLSRVAESRHFMTDVFAGWSLATAWISICITWYKQKK